MTRYLYDAVFVVGCLSTLDVASLLAVWMLVPSVSGLAVWMLVPSVSGLAV